MRDLSRWPDGTFDLIVHPLSNLYVPDVTPVWREAHRVLRPGGVLLSGFMNPHVNLFDQETWQHPNPPLRFTLPYSELTSLPAPERDALIEGGDVLQFSHTLDDQLGGQLRAGFLLAGFFEDRAAGHPLAPFLATHLASRAVKP